MAVVRRGKGRFRVVARRSNACCGAVAAVGERDNRHIFALCTQLQTRSMMKGRPNAAGSQSIYVIAPRNALAAATTLADKPK